MYQAVDEQSTDTVPMQFTMDEDLYVLDELERRERALRFDAEHFIWTDALAQMSPEETHSVTSVGYLRHLRSQILRELLSERNSPETIGIVIIGESRELGRCYRELARTLEDLDVYRETGPLNPPCEGADSYLLITNTDDAYRFHWDGYDLCNEAITHPSEMPDNCSIVGRWLLTRCDEQRLYNSVSHRLRDNGY